MLTTRPSLNCPRALLTVVLTAAVLATCFVAAAAPVSHGDPTAARRSQIEPPTQPHGPAGHGADDRCVAAPSACA